jgi:hypothetical protein
MFLALQMSKAESFARFSSIRSTILSLQQGRRWRIAERTRGSAGHGQERKNAQNHRVAQDGFETVSNSYLEKSWFPCFANGLCVSIGMHVFSYCRRITT